MLAEFPLVRLGEHVEKIGSGATPRGGADVYLSSGIALIRSQNVYNNRFSYDGLAYISDEHAEQLSNVTVQPDDVLLNITGDSVARVCQVPQAVLPARVNQHVAIVRPLPSSFDLRYLRYFLVSPYMQAYMLSLAGSGGTRNALTKSMIENFRVPRPPLPEQRAIAHILGTLDDKIELNRQLNHTLEAIARAIFKSWFVDFDPVWANMEGRPYPLDPATRALFPATFEESANGEIPAGWRVVPLQEVITIHDSKRIPLSRRERAERVGPYPYYGATGILDYVDDYLFEGIHLLMAEDGSVMTENQTPVLQYVWGQFWVSNHAHVLQGKSSISTEHLMVALQQTNINPFITGAVQLKLSQRNMNSIPFVLAPPAVNRAYQLIVDPLFALIRAQTEQTKTLTSLRDTLLPKLISGELRVPAAAELIAEVAP